MNDHLGCLLTTSHTVAGVTRRGRIAAGFLITLWAVVLL